MKRLNFPIKTFLLTCVVTSSQTYAFECNSEPLDNLDNISGSLDEYNSSPPEIMTKTHTIILTITNETDYDLIKWGDWFDSGRLGDGWEWPISIPAHGGKEKVVLYENDWSLSGCSGYVIYQFKDYGLITISFSNPAIGQNKVNAGTGGRKVWYCMGDRNYKEFTQTFTVEGVNFKAVLKSTSGSTNKASVVLSNDDDDDEDKP